MSDSLWPRELQHTRIPCPSLSSWVCSNSCPLSQWCHPTISSSVTPFSSCHPIFPSIRIFSYELAPHIRWPKYWSFSINPYNEYSGLISFRIDWFDLCALQGTLKSLIQHHNLKASILQCSAFFMVQLSHLYTPYSLSSTRIPEGSLLKIQDRSCFLDTLWGLPSHSRSSVQLPYPQGLVHFTPSLAHFTLQLPYCLSHTGPQAVPRAFTTVPQLHSGSLCLLLPLEYSLLNSCIIYLSSLRSVPNCHLSERPLLNSI